MSHSKENEQEKTEENAASRKSKKSYTSGVDRNILIPSRGIVEDWSIENEDELLRKKKKYAEQVLKEANIGSPDLVPLLNDFLSGGERSRVEENILEPVRFTADKEYRPSFSLLQKVTDERAVSTVKEKLLTIKMDAQIQSLAQEQVLVRLKQMTILDWKSMLNRDSDIYVISTVVDDDSTDPIKCELRSFPHIRKGDTLTIGVPYGVKMYHRAGRVPSYLDMRILVARSKQGVRDAGEALSSIRNNDNFKSAVQELSSLVTGPIGIVTNQLDEIMGIIGAILKLQKDDQLLYYPVTLSKDFDNLGVGEQICETTRFVEFCYQIQVGSAHKT